MLTCSYRKATVRIAGSDDSDASLLLARSTQPSDSMAVRGEVIQICSTSTTAPPPQNITFSHSTDSCSTRDSAS